MVRSNQIAAEAANALLASASNNASALNVDTVPLLKQDSAPFAKEENGLPTTRQAVRKGKAKKRTSEEGDNVSKATLQLVLEDWEPPSDKAAKLAHVKTHYHHELFSLSDTRTEDLAEFGQGLALYFYFLRWIALLLAAMSLVVLPNMVWNAIARNSGTSTTGTPTFVPFWYLGCPAVHTCCILYAAARPVYLQAYWSPQAWAHLGRCSAVTISIILLPYKLI